MIRKTQKINNASFYAQAFSEDFRVLWLSTPFKHLSDTLSLAYFRAITCWLALDADDEYDRRLLLYTFLKMEGTDEAYLDEKFATLPISDNLFKKVSRNVLSAYSEQPKRTFSLSKEENEKFQKYYKNSGFDAVAKQAYKVAGFTNVVAVRPKHVRKANGKYVTEHEFVTPDMFRVEVSPIDPLDVVSIAIPYQAEDGVRIRIWTANEIRIKDLDGKTLSNEPNRYGQIPYVFMRFSEGKDFYGGGDIALVQAQLYSNKMRLFGDESVTYSALSVWIGTNLEGDANGKFKLSPRKVVNFNKVANPDVGQPLPPELANIAAQPFFTEINDYRKALDFEELRMREIPEDAITEGNGTPLSGVARLIAQQGLTEARNDHADRLRSFEKNYAELFALVLNTDAGQNLTTDLQDFQIDFAEPRWFLELKDEYEFDTTKIAIGLLKPSEFVKKWAGVDGELTEEKAVQFMMDNKELFKKLEAGTVPENNIQQVQNAAVAAVE